MPRPRPSPRPSLRCASLPDGELDAGAVAEEGEDSVVVLLAFTALRTVKLALRQLQVAQPLSSALTIQRWKGSSCERPAKLRAVQK